MELTDQEKQTILDVATKNGYDGNEEFLKVFTKLYIQFREAILLGNIPVCKEILMEMNRIDEQISTVVK